MTSDRPRSTDEATMDEPSRTEPPPGGTPVVPVENRVIEALVAADWTIAIAESLTGGVISALLCSCPGTEDRMLGGVVSYATAAKRRVLDVRGDVVTGDAALTMARSVRDLFGADVGLSLTGVAGPERQEGQPVGTVFVGWRTPAHDGCTHLSLAGAPEQIRREAAAAALEVLLHALEADVAESASS
jgi:PncC family amidohydrolase